MTLVAATLSVALSAAPWLLLGLTIAGLIKALLDENSAGTRLCPKQISGWCAQAK